MRDGNYKQGRHELQNNDGEFCCLGVACAVFQKTLKLKVEKNTNNNNFEYNKEAFEPPAKLLDYLGLSKDSMQLLMALNDVAELSFDHIASVIENLEIVR